MSEELIKELMTAYEATVSMSEESHVTLSIGKHTAHLSFSGNALKYTILKSLNGLRTDSQDAPSPSLRVYVWDASCGINFLSKTLKQELNKYANKLTVINRASACEGAIEYNSQGEILSLVDTRKRIAFYFSPDSSKLPDYEVGAPMRMIMNFFCKINGMLMVHAAAIGFNGIGTLLVGRGGAGKSTTALLSLLNGFDFIGDDYIAISTDGDRMAYHLYRGCKISDNALEKLVGLAPYVTEANKTQQKNLIMLNETAGNLVTSLPIHMIIRPTIKQGAVSSFQKLPKMQVLMEFAGTTILQMPGNDNEMLREITNFCKELPSYSMLLSTNFSEIAESLKNFLVQDLVST